MLQLHTIHFGVFTMFEPTIQCSANLFSISPKLWDNFTTPEILFLKVHLWFLFQIRILHHVCSHTEEICWF